MFSECSPDGFLKKLRFIIALNPFSANKEIYNCTLVNLVAFLFIISTI